MASTVRSEAIAKLIDMRTPGELLMKRVLINANRIKSCGNRTGGKSVKMIEVKIVKPIGSVIEIRPAMIHTILMKECSFFDKFFHDCPIIRTILRSSAT
jgi:hypothetical protein